MGKIDILKEIIYDELSTHSQSKSSGYFPHANCEIMCAVRLSGEILMCDFEDVMELAQFIHHSWMDIEIKDAQVEDIIKKAMRLRRGDPDFAESITKTKENMSGAVEPIEPKKKISVGEEFMEFAEKYYGIKGLYNKEILLVTDSESCPYDSVKDVFIKKIDQIIQERLSDK